MRVCQLLKWTVHYYFAGSFVCVPSQFQYFISLNLVLYDPIAK
jgi:hypothetical protein